MTGVDPAVRSVPSGIHATAGIIARPEPDTDSFQGAIGPVHVTGAHDLNNSLRMLGLTLAISIAATATGCRKHDTSADDDAPQAKAAADTAAQAADAPPAASGAAPAGAGFDIDSIPVSTATLGPFPYVTLPAGYKVSNTEDKAFARFPFWVKGAPSWVEGRFQLTEFVPEDGHAMSEYEVVRNFEALVSQMGGQKVSEEKIPGQVIDGWGNEITQGFITGLGDVYNEPARTYVVHRDDGNVWLQLVTNSAEGWYIVGKEKAFARTAQLIPASELKAQIDTAGKVALHVNFATDRTDILPDSRPQIAQVVQLLEQDPGLKLAVNGYTDDTGNAAHNQALSEGRARAVAAAVTAQGIDAARLSAAGFGASDPVADNGSEAGKARNRRVELVKR